MTLLDIKIKREEKTLRKRWPHSIDINQLLEFLMDKLTLDGLLMHKRCKGCSYHNGSEKSPHCFHSEKPWAKYALTEECPYKA